MAHPLRPQGGANIKGDDTASRDSWHMLTLSGLALLLLGSLVLLLSGRLALLMPGLEARRAVPGPQTLWLAQDLLLWLTWHVLPWLARLALLPELEGQVQQGWFCGRTKNEAIVVPPLVARDTPADRVRAAGFSRATAAFCPR